MTSATSNELEAEMVEPQGQRLESALPDLDLSDVSSLLARLVEERIPLALIADLANPGGPDSDHIMASEALDVG